ncbi:MAG: flavin reductase [Clostridia bacterium]|nr:flavin reductase [Clostridia bacterium]
MREITVNEWKDNPFETIGQEWLLVGAGDQSGTNAMTASWGQIGELWGTHVMTVFIRPQRYTWEFMQREELFTCQVLPEELHGVHKVFGTQSGRDLDKAAECGLTPVYTDGTFHYKEARLVVVCRKLYVQQLRGECFLDKSLDEKVYPEKDYHYVVVGKIEKIYVKED